MKRTSIVTRIALAATVPSVVFALAMLVLIKTGLESAIYAATDARVQVAQNTLFELIREKGPPSLRNGTLRFGSWAADNDNSLVDRERSIAGADASLFAILGGKPIRVSTTIVKANGNRNARTELTGPARTAFDAGQSFAGVSPVSGRDYLSRSDPLRDRSGKVIGIAYTGIPLTALYHAESVMLRWGIIATLSALAISLGLLYVVTRPLRRVFADAVRMAQGLAAGEVDQHSNTVANGELGDVNLAFEAMIRYQQRMASVADSFANGDFSVDVKPVSQRDRLGVAFASMSRNLSQLVRQLEGFAMTDSLTKLGNRRAYDVRMRTEIARAARVGSNLSLALVDVDHFKSINDRYGHQHGDVVLSALARVLSGLRAEDCAYRLGGDEFAVILADSDSGDAKLDLERIREQAHSELHGATVTIGVATSVKGFTDSHVLRRQADAALYVGEQRGRNIVVTFDDAQSRHAIPQQMSANSVTRLITDGGLDVSFQPIWDVRRGAILGFEALARPDASYGLGGPLEAFEVAAKMGRAHELDKVCRDAAIARATEMPPGTLLFLNVSPETLSRDCLPPEELAASLAAVGVTPERVVLEITERFEGSTDQVIAAASALQRFGFKLAHDDAGAGNAGLELLNRLPVDFIKIDGQIVANATRDRSARGVIAAIHAFASTTGAYVIGEGIEDQEMLETVRAEISGAQGYYLGRPEPTFSNSRADAAVALLSEHAEDVPAPQLLP